MPIRLSKLFEKPPRLVKDDATATKTYARYIAEPFEIGYGRTLGNSLRRVLLSSIEGAAVTACRIDGAAHEFCAINGVVEDVTDIVLNIKDVLLVKSIRERVVVRVKAKGPREVTAADIQGGGNVTVINPDCHVATLAADGVLDMELDVSTGRGYCPVEAVKAKEQVIGTIPMDAIFSPVRRVNFTIENTRVGQRTDYEKLILEVWTDGRKTADEAMKEASAILQRHVNVFVEYSGADEIEFEEAESRVDEAREDLRKTLAMSVNEIELSVRAANCLNNANITTVGQLAQKSESDMLKYRNFGKKSLNEIKQKLSELKLQLGMTFEEDLLKGLEAAE
jgi:DNA-directed RNA polymerase subunit alpha